MTNLNYEAMKTFASGFGQMTFGFGDGKSYCTDYAVKTLLQGGATLKSYDIMGLMNQTEIIINKKGSTMAIWEVIRLILRGPTVENISKDIKEANPSLPSGSFKC